MYNNYLPKTAAELQQLLGLIPHPEGGFFLETFRSGSTPMTSRGQTDSNVPDHDLVDVPSRAKDCRPDGDIRRNCLTSIYWVPTKADPRLPLTVNRSDHVHYYQGGQPFEYTVYNPETQQVHTQIVGPDLGNGHVLQFAVKGGLWKCGRLLAVPEINAEYAILAEAVAPGFDFHDFGFVQQAQLADHVVSREQALVLEPYLHHASSEQAVRSKKDQNEDFDRHYDMQQVLEARRPSVVAART